MVKYVKTGDKVVISKPSAKETDMSYISQTEEVISDKQVAALVPVASGQLLRLPEKALYNFVFHTDKGMILFEGKVGSYYREDSIFFMTVNLLTKGEPFQRREFFRFDCGVPIKFCTIADNERDVRVSMDLKMFEGESLDISGGGLRLATNEKLENSSRIRCVIDLDTEAVIVICKVIGGEEVRNAKLGQYKMIYRLEYSGITKADQDRIVKYIFNKQRQMLKLK